MDTEPLFVCEDDYKFFTGLANDEKILCLFDIWVMQYDTDTMDMDIIKDIIDLSIKNSDMANVVITNDMVIINADSYKLVRTAAQLLFEQGFVLERKILTDAGNEVFRRQKYCNVYSVVGVANPIIQN